MLQSKLYQVFAVLSAAQKRELRGWIRLPLINQREEVEQLWAFLENGNTANIGDFHRDKAIDFVFGKNKMAEKQNLQQDLRYAQTWLLTAIEKYLIYKESNENNTQNAASLAKAYKKLRLQKPQLQALDAAFAKIKQAENDFQTLQIRYELESERYQSLSENQRNGELNLLELGDSLDVSFMANKLRQACYALSHQAVSQEKYEVRFLENVLLQIENEPILLEQPLILGYYTAFCLNSQRVSPVFVDNYAQYKVILLNETLVFSTKIEHDLLLFAINFCIKKINSGENTFFNEILSWYKYGLRQLILVENNEISPFTYRNIVTAACRCREFDWAKTFLNDYREKLPISVRKSVFDLNFARLCYEARDFDAAMPVLSQFSSEDVLQNFAAKTLMLKMLFELKEFDALDAFLSSFSQYIRRNGVKTGYHQANYQNIVRFTRKILTTTGKNNRELLAEEIKTTSPLLEKVWLLQQI